jgi:hypothetical protein
MTAENAVLHAHLKSSSSSHTSVHMASCAGLFCWFPGPGTIPFILLTMRIQMISVIDQLSAHNVLSVIASFLVLLSLLLSTVNRLPKRVGLVVSASGIDAPTASRRVCAQLISPSSLASSRRMDRIAGGFRSSGNTGAQPIKTDQVQVFMQELSSLVRAQRCHWIALAMHTLLALALVLPLVYATPFAPPSTVVHERRDSVPAGFVKVGTAPAEQMLTLRVGLVQGDMAGLEERLMAVSTPSSSEFRQWLSKEEARLFFLYFVSSDADFGAQVESFVTPKQDTLDAVNSFLSANGITSQAMTPAGDMISINVTVAQANTLFNTQFDTFEHAETGQQSVRTLEYSLPSALKDHIEFVHPTTTYVRR